MQTTGLELLVGVENRLVMTILFVCFLNYARRRPISTAKTAFMVLKPTRIAWRKAQIMPTGRKSVSNEKTCASLGKLTEKDWDPEEYKHSIV